jgi:replication factor A2
MSKPHVNANIGNPNLPNQFRLANNQAPVSGNTAGNDATNLVLSVFNDPAVIHLEHGLTMQYVINCLKNLPEEAVRKAIDYHVEVGNIYNTIDDSHFRSVMNG